jgi:hypothetical protein
VKRKNIFEQRQPLPCNACEQERNLFESIGMPYAGMDRFQWQEFGRPERGQTGKVRVVAAPFHGDTFFGGLKDERSWEVWSVPRIADKNGFEVEEKYKRFVTAEDAAQFAESLIIELKEALGLLPAASDLAGDPLEPKGVETDTSCLQI